MTCWSEITPPGLKPLQSDRKRISLRFVQTHLKNFLGGKFGEKIREKTFPHFSTSGRCGAKLQIDDISCKCSERASKESLYLDRKYQTIFGCSGSHTPPPRARKASSSFVGLALNAKGTTPSVFMAIMMAQSHVTTSQTDWRNNGHSSCGPVVNARFGV